MKRKGISIAELIITIAIASILLVTVIGFIVSVNKIAKERNELNDINSELVFVQDKIFAWFNGFDNSSFPSPSISLDKQSLSFGDDFVTFNTLDRVLICGDNSFSLYFVSNVYFESNALDSNFVKCSIVYTERQTTKIRVFSLLKHSVNIS